MEIALPIETCVGILCGRDAIYLDTVIQDDSGAVIFRGTLNGALTPANGSGKEWLSYTLTFPHVLACFYCELDTYESMTDTKQPNTSSFALIENSEWLQSLPVRKDFEKKRYKHYRVFTYDVVYNIIATEYWLTVNM